MTRGRLVALVPIHLNLRTSVAMATLLLALALAILPSAASARVKYLGRVSCLEDEWASDRVCFVGDLPGAHFRVWGRDHVRYSVCVTGPSGGTSCKHKTTGLSGETSSTPIRSTAVGRYSIVWRVHGRIKAQASFNLRSEGV